MFVMNVLNLEKYKKHLQNQNLENQTNLRKIKQQNKIILKMNLKKNWLKILMLKLEKPENLKTYQEKN